MIAMATKRRQYTPDEDAKIRGADTREALEQIAAKLGRTFTAVQKHRQILVGEPDIDWHAVLRRIELMRMQDVPADDIRSQLGLTDDQYKRANARLAMRDMAASHRRIEAKRAADPLLAERLRERRGLEEARRDQPVYHAPAESTPQPTLAELADDCVRIYRKAWASIHKSGKASDREGLWGARPSHGSCTWAAGYAVGKQHVHVGSFPTEREAHEAAVAHRDAHHRRESA